MAKFFRPCVEVLEDITAPSGFNFFAFPQAAPAPVDFDFSAAFNAAWAETQALRTAQYPVAQGGFFNFPMGAPDTYVPTPGAPTMLFGMGAPPPPMSVFGNVLGMIAPPPPPPNPFGNPFGAVPPQPATQFGNPFGMPTRLLPDYGPPTPFQPTLAVSILPLGNPTSLTLSFLELPFQQSSNEQPVIYSDPWLSPLLGKDELTEELCKS